MRNFLLSTVVVCAPFAASAATLTGDTVDITIHGVGSQSVVVGQGADFQLLGISLDFDAGSSNMQLSWDSDLLGTFGAFTDWTFSDLDFDDGSDLVAFVVSDTQFSGLSVATTSDSVTFSFDANATFDTGSLLSGSFVTNSQPPRQLRQVPTSVPLPATAPLLVLGAAGLVALRRRRARG